MTITSAGNFIYKLLNGDARIANTKNWFMAYVPAGYEYENYSIIRED